MLYTWAHVNSEDLSFHHYQVENGLSFNTVRKIIQDRNGFIWVGTENGLNRFDGLSFKIFRYPKDSLNSPGSDYICSLLQDSKGTIRIGTDQGVYSLDPITGRFTHFTLQTRGGVSITSEISNIAEDQNGDIWFSTFGQGVFRYIPSKGTLEQYKPLVDKNSGTLCDMITYVFADHSNQIWIIARSHIDQLFVFNREKGQFDFRPMTAGNKKLPSTMYKILEDSHHTLWLGTWEQGLCRYDPVSNEISYYLSPDKPNGILHIHDIFEYKPGILLIGSDDGLSIFNINTLYHKLFTSTQTDLSSLSDRFVYPICKDREGGVWIGTYYGGINYLPPSGRMFERYTHSRYTNSVNGNVIGGFTEDNMGNIWIASDDGGLNYLDIRTGKFTAFMPQPGKNSISYHNVHGLCWDDDRLWIGTYTGGLNVYDIRTRKFGYYKSTKNNPNTLDNTSIYSIFRDNQKQIWVGTMSGINLYHRSGDYFIPKKNLGTTTVDIVQDSLGMLWFATWGKGLFRYDPQTDEWHNFTYHPGTNRSILSNQVNCLTIDKKGILWIGTTNGLCYYDGHSFYSVKLNVPSQTICGIVDDGDVLWLTTAKGLIRYQISNRTCLVFTQKDGLLSDQFIFNSAFKSSKGKVYIGTASGFNAFYPKNIVSNTFIPPVVINRLEIFNKEVNLADYGTLTDDGSTYQQIDLSYKDNVFSLGFVALSYSQPEKNRYAYKLEGFDNDWNYANSQPEATYTNLPAGEYLFRVKACNNDGVWNEQGAGLAVVIHPPFWLTLECKLLYLLMILVLLGLAIKLFLNRANRIHEAKITRLNQEKEKEVYDAKIGFFTMIAHEIRTPVSLIIGPLEKMMELKADIPEIVRNNLNIIDRNSQRLLLLVNQLLDFRKAEQGTLIISLSRTNVYELLKSIFDRFLPLKEQHGVEFAFDFPDTEFEADIDPEFVNKIVSNLLSNALKFAHSKIVLICRANYEQKNFDIQVNDDGPGISDAEKEKIFLPFYQINPIQKSGTGIGLSLVKNLVDVHKGSIAVMDALPSGASFLVTLPIGNNSAPSARINAIDDLLPPYAEIIPDVNEATADITDDKEKPFLLIVEDNQEMRNFLCDSFRTEYQVVSAEDGLDGLEKMRTIEADLVISDLMMPRMDGLAFCKSLKSNILTSHIPVILLTAKTDINSKIEGLNYGADAYVEKPFSIRFLKAQIKNLIESRKTLHNKFAGMPFVSINSMAGNQADEEFLSKMNTIIEDNISNVGFSIDLLAEQLCISRSGLFTKIKSLTGITPNDLIQVVRLKKAAELLSGNRYRINEVAYMVGFNDASYFSKCFVKQFGIRPVDFINKSRNQVSYDSRAEA
jgi:signal transduction histidine kinase/ligand-binding sensor domain-containing protein/DNA-binding response OmpR family regulator